MALLTGGVSATENLPPLEGNVTQNVDKNTASAGGNVFNQVYAPAIDTTGLQRIPTVLPAASISNLPQATLQPVQFTPQAVQSNTTGYQRIPSVPLNLPSGQNVIGGIQYSPNQLLAYNPTPQGPSFRPGQAQSDAGGGPPVAPSYQQQTPDFPQPVTTPPQLTPMRPQMAPQPMINPGIIGQAQGLVSQYARPMSPLEAQAYRDQQLVNQYARGMMTQPTLPVGNYSRMARFMQGLTRNNQAQAIAHQRAVQQYNNQVMQNRRAGMNTLGANARSVLGQAASDRRAENRAVGQILNKYLNTPPSAGTYNTMVKDFLTQWPDPKDPEQMAARVRAAEEIWQNTHVDLSPWLTVPGTAQQTIQTGRELRNEGTRIKNDIAQQTKQDVIDKKHADALAAMDRARFLAQTHDDRVRYEKLKADNTAFKLQLAKQFGEQMAQSLLDSRYSDLVSKEISALESAAKGDKGVLDQWNKIQSRKAQAIALDDGELLKQAEAEEKSFGEKQDGVPVVVRTAIKNLNGLAAGIGSKAEQNIKPELRQEIRNTLVETAQGLKAGGYKTVEPGTRQTQSESVRGLDAETVRRLGQLPPSDVKTPERLGDMSRSELEAYRDAITRMLKTPSAHQKKKVNEPPAEPKPLYYKPNKAGDAGDGIYKGGDLISPQRDNRDLTPEEKKFLERYNSINRSSQPMPPSMSKRFTNLWNKYGGSYTDNPAMRKLMTGSSDWYDNPDYVRGTSTLGGPLKGGMQYQSMRGVGTAKILPREK